MGWFASSHGSRAHNLGAKVRKIWHIGKSKVRFLQKVEWFLRKVELQGSEMRDKKVLRSFGIVLSARPFHL